MESNFNDSNSNRLSDDLKKIVVSEEELRGIISRMAKEITHDYEGKNLLVCGILKGCFIFMADLVRKIELPAKVSFIKVSSYGAGRESGELKVTEIAGELDNYKGYDILIVDDILDTGNTLCYLEEYLRGKGFASINFCALLDKPSRRNPHCEINVKYTGKQIENEFVVGYGLDFDEKYRNLPFVAAVR